jgi:hypothetical protein
VTDVGVVDSTYPPLAFPVQATWIPNLDQVRTTGETILQVSGQALDQFQGDNGDPTRGTPYTRRVLTTGQIVPLVPELDGQLCVSVFEMFFGRAGEQQFQFFKGTLGTLSQKVVRYQVTLARTSPLPKAGIAPRLQRASELEDRAGTLWTDAWVVWSALLAMVLGGVTNAETGAQVSAAPITQDNILIGAVAFEEPNGGLARVTIEVQVQM